MPRATKKSNPSSQVRATTAAKRARLEEAGLEGRRSGEESARTKGAQAQRDDRQAKSAASVEAAKAKAAAAAKALKDKAAPASAPKKPAAKKAPASKKRMGRSSPLIEIRTSNSVKGSAKLDAYAESVVSGGLSRFASRLTRIDVYLSDENAEKESPNDKRCQIEARPASQKPVSATATASTIEKALTVAVGKMKRLLTTRFDKQSRH